MRLNIMTMCGLIMILFLSSFPSRNISAHIAIKDQDEEIRQLISQLYNYPEVTILQANSGASFLWVIALTKEMRKLIEIGPTAQKALLEKLNDEAIKDQVSIILGGIGDENVIEPLILAMVKKDEVSQVKKARHTNLCVSLALTNITFADTIWPYGRHAAYTEKCHDSAKECWLSWWKANQHTFVLEQVNRNKEFEFYPNYGRYKLSKK